MKLVRYIKGIFKQVETILYLDDGELRMTESISTSVVCALLSDISGRKLSYVFWKVFSFASRQASWRWTVLNYLVTIRPYCMPRDISISHVIATNPPQANCDLKVCLFRGLDHILCKHSLIIICLPLRETYIVLPSVHVSPVRPSVRSSVRLSVPEFFVVLAKTFPLCNVRVKFAKCQFLVHFERFLQFWFQKWLYFLYYRSWIFFQIQRRFCCSTGFDHA